MVKIKLALLESDEVYLKKITNIFNSKYEKKVEIYAFNNVKSLEQFLNDKSTRVDIVICTENVKFDIAKLPQNCGFAYFCASNSVESLYGQKTICKFQKIDLLYQEILNIFSETSEYHLELSQVSDGKQQIFFFTSASGGVGTSTLAVAAANFLSNKGKKVLYLNLETFGISQTYFNKICDPNTLKQNSFDNIIYAIKSKKSNISLRIESCINYDNNVGYFNSARNALDVEEINVNDLEKLFDDLAIMGKFDVVIVDANFKLDEKTVYILKKSGLVILVSDGSLIANDKSVFAMNAVDVIEKKHSCLINQKLMIAYNKFGSKFSTQIGNINNKVLGGVPYFSDMPTNNIINNISTMNMFDQLYIE